MRCCGKRYSKHEFLGNVGTLGYLPTFHDKPRPRVHACGTGLGALGRASRARRAQIGRQVFGTVDQAGCMRRVRIEHRQARVVEAFRRGTSRPQPSVAMNNRPAYQAVSHHDEMAVELTAPSRDQREGQSHALMKLIPALPARRNELRRKGVGGELLVRRAAQIAKVALLQQRCLFDAETRARQKRSRGHAGARQVAAQHMREAERTQPLAQQIGLPPPAFIERNLCSLQHPSCVAGGLPVTHEQNRHQPGL
jgi:hypothetical protein